MMLVRTGGGGCEDYLLGLPVIIGTLFILTGQLLIITLLTPSLSASL